MDRGLDADADGCVLWERRCAQLAQWRSAHGNCNVPKAEGKLGRWVVRQRELHKKGKLEPQRKARLDRLAFVWNTNEAAWENRYALLLRYYHRHGHCCVPISDPHLGMWVAKMRANRRKNKLPLHRVRKLDAIGFIWNTAEADWMDKFNKLLHFRAVHGHSCVPFNEGELGWWVNTQRQSKRKGKLAAHRERLLNDAAFIWNPQHFLAERRRQAARARAAAAANAPPLTKRPLATTSEPPSQSHTPKQPSAKRRKPPQSPLIQKPLFRPLQSSPSTHVASFHYTPPQHTPVSILNAPITATPLAASVSYTAPLIDRPEMHSIASLLSPSAESTRIPKLVLPSRAIDFSSAPAGAETTTSDPHPQLPSLLPASAALTPVLPNRSQSPRFVLPPISSLKVLTNPTLF